MLKNISKFQSLCEPRCFAFSTTFEKDWQKLLKDQSLHEIFHRDLKIIRKAVDEDCLHSLAGIFDFFLYSLNNKDLRSLKHVTTGRLYNELEGFIRWIDKNSLHFEGFPKNDEYGENTVTIVDEILAFDVTLGYSIENKEDRFDNMTFYNMLYKNFFKKYLAMRKGEIIPKLNQSNWILDLGMRSDIKLKVVDQKNQLILGDNAPTPHVKYIAQFVCGAKNKQKYTILPPESRTDPNFDFSKLDMHWKISNVNYLFNQSSFAYLFDN